MMMIRTFVLSLGLFWIASINAQQIHSTIQLTSPDATIAEKFGWDVCIHGDWIFASAPWDDDSVFGDGGINFNSGSVHCYWWNGQTWIWHSKITAEIPQTNMLFGYNIDINQEQLLISAPGDIGNGESSGAVYQFEWNGNAWIELNRIVPVIGQQIENFGGTIASSDNWLWIGGNIDDQLSGIQAYKWISDEWIYQQDISWAYEGFDSFSPAFACDESRMIVGHPGNDLPLNNVGGATNYVWNENSWSTLGAITASDITQGDEFGWSISLNDGWLAISAPCINGNQPGRIFMFSNQDGLWIEDHIIQRESASGADQFGRAISINDDMLIATAGGIDEIIIHSEIGSEWVQIDSYHPVGTGEDDEFGASIWAQDDWIVTGAPGHDVGIDYDQGAIYISQIKGCMDETACNFHSWSELEGICEYPACDDPMAMNFNSAPYCTGGWCEYFGDLDHSGHVTMADLLVLLTVFGCNGDCDHDMTQDDAINTADLVAWLSAY